VTFTAQDKAAISIMKKLHDAGGPPAISKVCEIVELVAHSVGADIDKECGVLRKRKK
jgi:hypothetical protein